MKGEIKFLADAMLGKLAKWLRILGYDTLYYRGTEALRLLDIAKKDDRILLTRNTRIPATAGGLEVVVIADDHWASQVRQVVKHFHLPKPRLAFTRCVNCNAVLQPLSRAQAQDRVPEHVFHVHNVFSVCPECQRVYWQGSHQQRMQATIHSLFCEEGERP